MKILYEVYHYTPEEAVTNWRNEVEVYGGLTDTKGLFTDKEFAHKVRAYVSKKNKKEYLVREVTLWDDSEEYTRKLMEDYMKGFIL